MKQGFKTFLVISLLYFTKTGLAQAPALPVDLSFQNFTQEDGLSDNYINRICQDSRGFIWISTPEGLNRFDGLAFKKFYAGKKEGNSLPSNLIDALIEYKKDYLLIASSNGLVVMNTIDQQFSRPKDSLLCSAIVSNFFIENNNAIWLSLNDAAGLSGIAKIDSSLVIQKIIWMKSKAYNGINNIHRLKNGQLIISTTSGYHLVDEQKKTFRPLEWQFKETAGITNNMFSYFDKITNSLYTSVWGKGLFVINLDDGRVKNFRTQSGSINCFPSLHATNVLRDSRGYLWIATGEGLCLFDKKNNGFITYHHKADESSSLVSNATTFLFEDREKNVWVGAADGLSKLSSAALLLNSYKKEFTIKGNSAIIYDIIKGPDEKIYIATYGNGVFSLSPRTGEIKKYGKDQIRFAWSVNKDSNTIIVTGHDKKMYRLYPATSQVQALEFLKPYQDTANLVLFAYTDRRGGKWYSMNMQQGLFYYPPNQTVPVHFSNQQFPAPFPHSYFNSVVEDEKGKVWFGVNKRSELVTYDFAAAAFSVYDFNRENKMRFSGINCLLADKNIIWAGTDGTGLIRLDPAANSIQVFTIEDGLSANNITSLILDKKRRLWVGTKKGLSCLLPGQERFISFSRADGLPEIYFNDESIYYDPEENRLYAGARASLISFNPDEFLRSVAQAKPLHIDEMLVNGKKIIFSKLTQLKLPYNQNNLQFSFTAIDFENPASINYYYKLEGADKDWIESGRQRTASYTNLSDGRYRFLVRVIKTGSEAHMDTQIPFAIIIDPPWWGTWWFRAIVILLIIALLYTLIRAYYRRQLEHQRIAYEKQQAVEQERTRIATDMHDDLGAGLSKIRFLSETIQRNIREEAHQPHLQNISISSVELVDKFNEIIWAMNEKNNALEDLLYYIRSYTAKYCAENNLEYNIIIPDNIPSTIISGEMRRHIFLIVKESLHNVVKHAHAKNVWICVQIDTLVTITIRDDGKGFKIDELKNAGNGLRNMEQRIKNVNGKIIIENINGTLLKISIPLPAG